MFLLVQVTFEIMVVNVGFLWLWLVISRDQSTLNFGYPGEFLFYLSHVFYCQKSRHLIKSNIKLERSHKGRWMFTVHCGGKSWLLVGYCYPRSIFEWYWTLEIQFQHRFILLVIVNCIMWDCLLVKISWFWHLS